jgi:hypothetical protein
MTIEYFNATQPWEIIPYLNRITGGWFAMLIILVIWMVGYMSLSNLHPKNAFTGATFLTLIISILFYFLGSLPMYVIIILLLFLFAGILFSSQD